MNYIKQQLQMFYDPITHTCNIPCQVIDNADDYHTNPTNAALYDMAMFLDRCDKYRNVNTNKGLLDRIHGLEMTIRQLRFEASEPNYFANDLNILRKERDRLRQENLELKDCIMPVSKSSFLVPIKELKRKNIVNAILKLAGLGWIGYAICQIF